MSLYSIVWKYQIRPENRELFELEYGLKGVWNAFFSSSKNHIGSYLFQSEDQPNTYMLIDTWTDKASYEKFKKVNKAKYDKLSSRFKPLYETEVKIGTFNAVK